MSRALEVNLMGAVRVVNEFFPLLREARGRIIFISSESTRAAMPFTGPYVVEQAGPGDVRRDPGARA